MKMIAILALIGVMFYFFPIIMFWLLLAILLVCIILAVIFILGISGAGTGETMGQVAIRFVEEFREYGFNYPHKRKRKK